MRDAVGLVEGLYPGAAAAGLRDFPESTEVTPPRIGEVYTRGTLTLARLGREAPIAAASPRGPAIRDALYGSAASRKLYPAGREEGAAALPASPVIGTDSPEQYERRDDIGQPRKRFPAKQSRRHERSPGLQPPRRSSTSAQPASTARSGARAANDEAPIIAGGHSLLPMMKLQLANPVT